MVLKTCFGLSGPGQGFLVLSQASCAGHDTHVQVFFSVLPARIQADVPGVLLTTSWADVHATGKLASRLHGLEISLYNCCRPVPQARTPTSTGAVPPTGR